jgi:Ca2+-binding RTX toxin-like protein
MPSPITITDKTVDSVLITDDQSLVAYNGVTVADTSTVSDTETVSIFDQTTGQTAVEAGTPYTGPVAGLTTEFIDLSPDNLNIATITPNSLIYSGSGNDSINVSQAGGNNIIDATGGSNFLVGGSGDDTFFLNDLNPAPGPSVPGSSVAFHL